MSFLHVHSVWTFASLPSSYLSEELTQFTWGVTVQKNHQARKRLRCRRHHLSWRWTFWWRRWCEAAKSLSLGCSLQTTAACWIWLHTRWSDRGRDASPDCAAWCPAERLHLPPATRLILHLICDVYTQYTHTHIYIYKYIYLPMSQFYSSFPSQSVLLQLSVLTFTCVRSLFNSASASFYSRIWDSPTFPSTVHIVRGGKTVKTWRKTNKETIISVFEVFVSLVHFTDDHFSRVYFKKANNHGNISGYALAFSSFTCVTLLFSRVPVVRWFAWRLNVIQQRLDEASWASSSLRGSTSSGNLENRKRSWSCARAATAIRL